MWSDVYSQHKTIFEWFDHCSHVASLLGKEGVLSDGHVMCFGPADWLDPGAASPVSKVSPHSLDYPMHCVGLVPWKQLWAQINTMLNEATINFYNHLTMANGKPMQHREKWYATCGVFYFEIHVFIRWFYHEHGHKIFVKRMSNRRNLVWNTAYIFCKNRVENYQK